MTKHSTLTNPNDLHYAKVRSFTGDPAYLTPDFADELIIATDTNKIYRATDTTQGAIVELVAPNTNNSSAITIGYEYPTARPEKAGELFYNGWAKQLYISVQNYVGLFWWRPIESLGQCLTGMITVSRGYPIDTTSYPPNFSLVYSGATPFQIESGNFNFTHVLDTNLLEGGNLDLSYYINEFGTGAYAITHDNFEGGIVDYAFSATGAIPASFEIRSTDFAFSVNGNVVSENKYIYFSGQKTDGVLDVAVNIALSVIGPG